MSAGRGELLATRRWAFSPALRVAAMAAILSTNAALAQDEAAEDGENEAAAEDVTKLAAYNVTADRVEDFGFRVRHRLTNPFATGSVYVAAVYPNTAAAKAGLQPGDRILKSDGRSASFSLFSLSKWRKFQQRKWADVRAGRKDVKWVLEVQSPGVPEAKVLELKVPTPAPHWGSSKWQPPADRSAVDVKEPGPLADLARTVLNNGVWIMLHSPSLGLPDRSEKSVFEGGVPFRAYQWQLRTGDRVHTILVSQQRGRTDLVLQTFSVETGGHEFLTSPSGAMEKAIHHRRNRKAPESTLDDRRSVFAGEMDFWLNKVGKVSARWPLEVRPDAVPTGTYVAVTGDQTAKPPPPGPATAMKATGKIAPEAAKLPVASAEQRTLFAEAYRKIGADADRWAYTETSTALDDKQVITMRVDPSRPDEQRCALLKVNGKKPTEADVQHWRDQGRDAPTTLGTLPPLERLVDLEDLRIFADEPAALVFELPLRTNNPEFPADRFQALFRVNKAQRSFEDIVVKMREAFRVAGVVKVTDAGIEMRFQTLDPALAPQPVYIKAGGAVRVLLVKFSRSFEAQRTDFKRVEKRVESDDDIVVPKPTLSL